MLLFCGVDTLYCLQINTAQREDCGFFPHILPIISSSISSIVVVVVFIQMHTLVKQDLFTGHCVDNLPLPQG